MLGFVLPLKNGLPEQNKYVATSAEVIENFFKIGSEAIYAYVIMLNLYLAMSLHIAYLCLAQIINLMQKIFLSGELL